MWPWSPKPEPVELDQDGLRDFLRGGGRVTLDDWLCLDDGTRASLAAAGRALAAEDAIAVAACMRGAEAHVARAIDGGRAHEEVTIQTALTGALHARFGGDRE